MDGKKIRLLQCKRFFKLHPWDESMQEYTKDRAATGRKRYHEARTSALVVALPAGRGSATLSNGYGTLEVRAMASQSPGGTFPVPAAWIARSRILRSGTSPVDLRYCTGRATWDRNAPDVRVWPDATNASNTAIDRAARSGALWPGIPPSGSSWEARWTRRSSVDSTFESRSGVCDFWNIPRKAASPNDLRISGFGVYPTCAASITQPSGAATATAKSCGGAGGKYASNFTSCGIPTGTMRVSGISPGRSLWRLTPATSDISRLAKP